MIILCLCVCAIRPHECIYRGYIGMSKSAHVEVKETIIPAIVSVGWRVFDN